MIDCVLNDKCCSAFNHNAEGGDIPNGFEWFCYALYKVLSYKDGQNACPLAAQFLDYG